MTNLINSKEIIATMLASFDIPHRGWINLSPVWINNAISEIELPSVWELVVVKEDLEDGSCELPCDIKLLESVFYGDYRLRLYHKFYNPAFNDHNDSYNSDIHMSIENGYINTDIDDDSDTKLVISYRRLKAEYDQMLGVSFPIIVDDDLLKMAIQWYLLRNIMLQGLKIDPLTFNPNVPDLNPFSQFKHYAKAARNSMSFTKQTMTEIHAMSNTMIL